MRGVLQEVQTAQCFYEPQMEYVLLERLDQATDSSIVIPDNAKEKSVRCKVVAVGEGRIIGGVVVPINLAPGDTVLITKYGGEDTELDGKKYVLCRASEIKLRLKQ